MCMFACRLGDRLAARLMFSLLFHNYFCLVLLLLFVLLYTHTHTPLCIILVCTCTHIHVPHYGCDLLSDVGIDIKLNLIWFYQIYNTCNSTWRNTPDRQTERETFKCKEVNSQSQQNVSQDWICQLAPAWCRKMDLCRPSWIETILTVLASCSIFMLTCISKITPSNYAGEHNY